MRLSTFGVIAATVTVLAVAGTEAVAAHPDSQGHQRQQVQQLQEQGAHADADSKERMRRAGIEGVLAQERDRFIPRLLRPRLP